MPVLLNFAPKVDVPDPQWRPAPTPCRLPERLSPLREERVIEVCECLIDICAALYNVSGRDIRQSRRTTNGVARVRQIAMYVAHVSLRLTMKEVGIGFFRDRTTVRHACHLIEDMRDETEFETILAMTERVAVAALRHRIEA